MPSSMTLAKSSLPSRSFVPGKACAAARPGSSKPHRSAENQRMMIAPIEKEDVHDYTPKRHALPGDCGIYCKQGEPGASATGVLLLLRSLTLPARQRSP